MIHTVIMAGGSGTRFWPASRKKNPKQFLSIVGDESMLGQTAERLLPLCGWDRMNVVASGVHVAGIRRILPDMPRENLLLEPRPRNTAPAIGLAALEISMRDPDGIMVVLPADHIIRPPGKFRKLIRAAATVAREGTLVTLGVRPTRPATGYGYIRAGHKIRQVGANDVFGVQGFTEKPDHPQALKYLNAGNYFWNSGMFVFSAAAILQALAAHMPKLYSGLEQVRNAPKRSRKATLKKVFDRLKGVSIDYGVMEKAGNIQMLPCDVSWSDVGSWAALPEVIKPDANGNLCKGDVLAIDSQGCVLQADKRLVACVGVQNLVVVETPDAILVCPVGEAQSVKQIVEELKRKKRDDVL
jgi:mannose-1-phosphate guanylyltransferase